MHIAVIRHSIRNRGGDKLILNYCTYLVQIGHTVEYWTNEIKTHFQIDQRICIRQIPIPGILGTLLFTLVYRFKTDIVLVDLVLMACAAHVRNRERALYLAQDYDVSYYKSRLLKNFTDCCYHLCFQRFKIPTISVAEGLSTTLQRYKPAQLTTIPNGVDLTVFFKNTSSPFGTHRKRKHVILLFARHDHRKGLDIGIKCIEELSKIRQHNDWEVWTIGEEVTGFTNTNILLKNFGFITTDIGLRDILSAADIYLIPSRGEGLSLLLLQALACECCVVTTTASSIIEHEQNGLVSPIEDYELLAKNLNCAMDDHELQNRLKKDAQLLAQKFSLEKSCEKFEQTLISVITNKGKDEFLCKS